MEEQSKYTASNPLYDAGYKDGHAAGVREEREKTQGELIDILQPLHYPSGVPKTLEDVRGEIQQLIDSLSPKEQ